MIHKTKYGSALKDNAPPNKRSTYCYQVVGNMEVTGLWRNVTCQNCMANRYYVDKKKPDKEEIWRG